MVLSLLYRIKWEGRCPITQKENSRFQMKPALDNPVDYHT